jgi:ectoine hydroxylase-related dioxygenase (phytanoyl-CoA dioxygenase family)
VWFDVGSHRPILDIVRSLVGDDVMLWGASLVKRVPGQTHHWHTDIETSEQIPGTVTVWVGLQNTSRESSLLLVRRSHKFGQTIQQRAQSAGRIREEVSREDVEGWAREIDASSDTVQFEMGDGEAVVFDGRVWHGSHNERVGEPRIALLLQYAHPSRAIRMADLTKLDFPFQFLDEPRPPCVLVSGTDGFGVNRIVPPPTPGGG